MEELNRMLLTSPLYWTVIIFNIAIVIVCKKFGAKITGWFGELWTKQELKKLPKDKYTVINDVFILVQGNTHQIDHVVVSCYGIFSIETKQYNGYITGSKYDKNWVRRTKRKVYYYTNPIRQNYGHVKSLSELLAIDESKIYNVVCIPSRAKLRIEHDGEVVRMGTIVEKILSYHDVVIDNVDEIVDIIRKNNITDKKLKKAHIENIRKNIGQKDKNRCPKCGGQLVEKVGKYGKFIGCANYPKCKYTRK